MSHAKQFEFTVSGLDADTFEVASFTGTEALSTLYSFEILLVSKQELTPGDVVNKPATFVSLATQSERAKRLGQQNDYPIHGVVAEFTRLPKFADYHQYKAVLRPTVWRLTLTRSSRIFLGKKTQAIIAEVLENDGKLAKGTDFKINVKYDEENWDYVCMFNESCFDFISQRMERNGIYYYFSQDKGQNREVMHIVDHKDVHDIKPGHAGIYYISHWKSVHKTLAEHMFNLSVQSRALPNKVILRDYNHEKANIEMHAAAVVDPNGLGEVYSYGEHLRTVDEAKTLSAIRKEELLCNQTLTTVESTCPSMRPGYTFQMIDWNEGKKRTNYCITRVEHQGQQWGYLHGILHKKHPDASRPVYSNTVTLIDPEVQFRPVRKTAKSRFYGQISAVIDGEGDPGKVYLNDKGHYTVIMPFDLSGRDQGKASHRIRLMHPYAGKDVTFHFPLLKGTEVLVSFIDGDPDRPVIAGAMHNSETPELVFNQNHHLNAIQTTSKQVMHISDKPGDEYIALGITGKRSFFRIESSDRNIGKTTVTKSEHSVHLGNTDKFQVGASMKTLVGTKSRFNLTAEFKLGVGPRYSMRFNLPESFRKKVYAAGTGALASKWLWAAGMVMPVDVKFNNNDCFEFGSGSTFYAKPSKTLLGTDKAQIYGGAHNMVNLKLKAAATLTQSVMTATTLLCLGVYAAHALKPKLKTTNANSWQDWLSNNIEWVGSSGFPNALTMVVLNKAIGNYRAICKDMVEKDLQIGGLVQCKNTGVTIQANTQGGGLDKAEVMIRSHDNRSKTGDHSYIKLTPNGESIEMKRGNSTLKKPECTITIKEDNVAWASKAPGKKSSLFFDKERMLVKIDNKNSQFLLTAVKNLVMLGKGNYMRQTPSDIELKLGSQLKLNRSSATLKGTTKTTIDAGMIYIG